MTIFLTADTHFGHARISGYCGRPWVDDVQEMDRVLIRNWNDRVGVNDTVLHLGDFALGPRENVARYRRQLHGRILLVRGNHDRSQEAMSEAGFDRVWSKPIFFNCHFGDFIPRNLQLLHRPPQALDAAADYGLCGHVHEAWRICPWNPRILNVGVDVWGYTPIVLSQVAEAFADAVSTTTAAPRRPRGLGD